MNPAGLSPRDKREFERLTREVVQLDENVRDLEARKKELPSEISKSQREQKQLDASMHDINSNIRKTELAIKKAEESLRQAEESRQTLLHDLAEAKSRWQAINERTAALNAESDTIGKDLRLKLTERRKITSKLAPLHTMLNNLPRR